MKKNKFSKCYVKYIINTPIIFYSFLSVGIFVFLLLSLTLRLDIVQTVKVKVEQNRIILDDEYILYSNAIYLYKDKNEEVRKLIIKSVDNISGDRKSVV